MEWQFKGENVRHIGPIARIFTMPSDQARRETAIASVDGDGMGLEAIQALKKRSERIDQ